MKSVTVYISGLLLAFFLATALTSCGVGLTLPGDETSDDSGTDDGGGDGDSGGGGDDETPPTLITDGLALYLDAWRADGTGPKSCPGHTWTDLTGGTSQTSVACGLWSGNGTPDRPYRVFFDGSFNSQGTYTYSAIQSDFTLELWAIPQYKTLIPTQSATGNLCCESDSANRFVWYPTLTGTPPGTDAVLGVALGVNGITLFEHGDDHFAPVLSHALPVENWKHIAVAVTNDRATLYINGTSVKTGEVSTKTVSPSLTGFGGGFFDKYVGTVSIARVYNRTLSPAEIQNNYDFEKDLFAGFDADGDGAVSTVSGGGDCEDSDPSIHPAANENCSDTIDNDCDGNTDLTDTECDLDDDTDGYESTATGGDDCNDSDAAINPAATEDGTMCDNSIDEDCSGADLDCNDWDHDSDGFTENEGDCDDSDPSFNPEALDACGVVADENCDLSDGVCLNDGASATFNGHNYKYFATGANWGTAVSNCIGEGGYLVHLDTQAEANFVASIVGMGTGVWVGTSDLESEGTWELTNGNAWPLSNWASAEPTGDTAQNCARLNRITLGQIEDTDCSTLAPYVCELMDGVGSSAILAFTDRDGDGETPNQGDCADTDPLVYASATENCANTVDDDCDSQIDCVDADCNEDNDSDGYSGNVTCGSDCNDADASIHPGAAEICTNATDEDCFGGVDDGCDDDSDGFADQVLGGNDCDDTDAATYPGAPETCGNGIDNDCNPSTPDTCPENCTDGLDNDGDGQTDCGDSDCYYDLDNDGHASPTNSCGGDCNDNNATIYPGAPEMCDGLNHDCDGYTDEGCDDDSDGYIDDDMGGDDCDDTNVARHPGAGEDCSGFLDMDCDGQIACSDSFCKHDADGDFSYAGDIVCTGVNPDCDDSDPSIHPTAGESCNDIDDDCDTTVDEGCDADWDGYENDDWGGTDCDDGNPAVNPGQTENCVDGIDNNCNASADCTDSACYSDLDGDTVPGVADPFCYGGALDGNDNDPEIQ